MALLKKKPCADDFPSYGAPFISVLPPGPRFRLMEVGDLVVRLLLLVGREKPVQTGRCSW